MYYHSFRTEKYQIIVAGSETTIQYLYIDSIYSSNTTNIPNSWINVPKYFKTSEKELIEYLKGIRKYFTIKISPKGTAFQREVWNQLINIPYGETRSYKQIAKTVNRPLAYRAVGMANNKNPIPIIIPCHRVVGTNGSLTGYSGGLQIKKDLLDIEKQKK